MCIKDGVSSTMSPSPSSSPSVSSSDQPTITFYTSRVGPPCRAVQIVITHLNIPVREVNLRCYIDTRTEEFKKINPCHTLPVIDDNGFVLWESRAIMQYLCNKFAPDSDLYPRDPRKRATVERLLNFDLKILGHAVLALHFEFTFPAEYSASRGEKLVAVTDALTLLEIFLINNLYVAGEHLTIADISILTSVTLLEVAVEFDLTTYPNIWNWYTRLRNELPYYDPLTKQVHSEFKALIQSVREAHEEWSTPMHKCAFVPINGNDSKCIQERKQQYHRLFLKPSDQQDVVRIMAAISPVFGSRHQQQRQQEDEKRQKEQTFQNIGRTGRLGARGAPYSIYRAGPGVQKTTRVEIGHSAETKKDSLTSVKRIKISIEPTGDEGLSLTSPTVAAAGVTQMPADLTGIDLSELSTLDNLDDILFDTNNSYATMSPNGNHLIFQGGPTSDSGHSLDSSGTSLGSLVSSGSDSNGTVDYQHQLPHQQQQYNNNLVSYQASYDWFSLNYHQPQEHQQHSMYPSNGPVLNHTHQYSYQVDPTLSLLPDMTLISQPTDGSGDILPSSVPDSMSFYYNNNETFCHN